MSWTRCCTKPAYLIYKFNLGNLPLKLRHCEKATKFEKKSPSSFDVYLVNQLICQNKREIFSHFFWPFQKSWTLPKLKSCWNARWYHIWNRYINAFSNFSLSDFLNAFSSKLMRLIFFWSSNLAKSYVDFMLDLRNTNISAKVIKIW